MGLPAFRSAGDAGPRAGGPQSWERHVEALEVIPGTGHFVFEDAPEQAAEALAAFLAGAVPR